ncbi:MAG TPA: metal-sulfur cluster assembly factor [Hanamia sp.]|nr:metal-sulfur cluster assembly factor [Hanamia sp.]
MNEITNDEVRCERALEDLHFVMDPEIGLNVVDLGLIYQLDFDEAAKKIYCTMTLTTQFCPMGESIQSGVTTSLQQTFPDFEPDVRVIFDPPWSAVKISPEGRDYLNM